MKESQARISTAAALAVAVVALLTVWFARHGTTDMPRPSEAITQQSVVTAPPVAASPEAAVRSSAMGGPPAPANATR
jgi:hypothetical protein